MEVRSVEAIVRRLNEAKVRYIIVGGVAVVAHGYLRFTSDLALMLDLEDESNVRRALEVLKDEGYVPRIPVPIEGFADTPLRESWVRDKAMLAYGLDSDRHPLTHVDLFARNVLDFEGNYVEAETLAIGDTSARVLSLDALIYLKELAARPQDAIDVAKLRILQEEKRREQRDESNP